MEQKIVFPSGSIEIEGLLNRQSDRRGAVITHPHPLYGGDMYNPVAEAIAGAYAANGFTALRFNFRGVGKSGGSYSDGPGEQADVMAALNYLRDTGVNSLDLAGYSFGAWVNARVGCGAPVDRMVMVSPPVNFMTFATETALPCLTCVVTGARDEFAVPDLVMETLKHWNPDAELEIIDGADHFYMGRLDALKRILTSAVRRNKAEEE